MIRTSQASPKAGCKLNTSNLGEETGKTIKLMITLGTILVKNIEKIGGNFFSLNQQVDL